MKGIHKFLHLSRLDRRLLIQATTLLWAIRLGLCLLPFQTLQRVLVNMSRKAVELQKTDHAALGRVAWAVEVASRYVPRNTCLTKALAAKVLLCRRGHTVHLHIGVAKGEAGRLRAHAWVESQGQIVIGGLGELSGFTQLPPLE